MATCAVLIFGFGVSVVWWAFWIPLHVFFYLLPALLAYPCHLLMTRPALFLTFSLSSAAAPLLQLLRTTLLLALVLLVAARHRSECVWVSSVWAAPICRDQSAMAGGEMGHGCRSEEGPERTWRVATLTEEDAHKLIQNTWILESIQSSFRDPKRFHSSPEARGQNWLQRGKSGR